MHRIYESTNAPTRVYWYDDRIEIMNPGGPFGVVTKENFGQPGITDYRNPNLADAIKVMGFVQKFGLGIQLAKNEVNYPAASCGASKARKQRKLLLM